MSAARRKGKWIGGFPVLGYDVPAGGGRLIVNDREAARVREIFKLYAKHRSLAAVVSELQVRQWTTKSWMTQHGARRVGTVFNKSKLLRLLTNATYAGRVEHKGTIYPGEQAAILEPQLWEEINAELRGARRGPNHVKRTKQDSLLNGLLFCRNCNQPMVPTYTAKGARRYRYYICQVARKQGWSVCPTKSISARVIEESIVKQLRSALRIDGAREPFGVSDADWLAFDEGDPVSLVLAVVKRVSYDGASGAVSLELGTK
jgi:site-specific DNA recombinase